jgi:ABC-type multidrug transport system ATPase subunit/pSer/pThr/pTyr-binding forkhead associated (FHA) protein
MDWAAWTQDIELTGDPVTIGRDPDNDLSIPAGFLAGRHASIEPSPDGYLIRDLSPGQGLISNGQFVKAVHLRNGSSVRIGDGESNLIRLTYQEWSPDRPILVPTETTRIDGLFTPWPVDGDVLIGRDPSCTLVLDHPLVARRQALIKRQADGLRVQDLRSRNGTFLNGRRIGVAPLREGDILQIGSYSGRLHGARFEPIDRQTSDALRIDVIGGELRIPTSKLRLNRRSSARLLLSGVNLTVMPGEFVAIVGGSGAGKTTLMKLMAGFHAPSQGSVMYNGLDLQRHRAAFSKLVGYVPQDDIVHLELTVESALRYAAKLRLPPDTGPDQIRDRVDDVLEAVDLSPQRKQVIKTLSGGQRKRVSIGVELLAQPRLLFLDEPTSGLDPGLDKRMMFLLRMLADRGHTVVLVTHTPAHLSLCDNVVFTGTGGHVTYFGPPHLIKSFFIQEDLADVFSAIENHEQATRWEQRFVDSSLYQDNVLSRRRSMTVAPPPQSSSILVTSWINSEPVRQLLLLTRRQLAILRNDRGNLSVLLLQAPIIGLLIALVTLGHPPFDPTVIAGKPSYVKAQNLAFMMACAVIWFAMLNSIRELVKERPIATRERMVGVQTIPYLGSKGLVLAGLATIQVLSLVMIIRWTRGLPPAGGFTNHPLWEMVITLELAALAATAIGLSVSAVSRSADRAMTYAPFILLPQIIFSGVIFTLPGPAVAISFLTVSRWAVGALAGTAGVANDEVIRGQGIVATSLGRLLLYWFALVVLIAAASVLAYLLQRRQESA